LNPLKTAGAHLGGRRHDIHNMKTTEHFHTKQRAQGFAARLADISGRRLYPSFYVMNGNYACTVSGDFTQEQINLAKRTR